MNLKDQGRKVFRLGVLHTECIGELVPVIAGSISEIFSKSLETGIILEDLTYASVNPVYKGVASYIAVNYRPVSLTDVLIKMFV